MGIFDLPPQFFVKNSSNVTKPNMLKRKLSDSQSDVSEDTRRGPATLVVDPEGDLYMKLNGGSLKVSRKALSLSSPVFLAMLGASSKFKEATNRTVDFDGVQILSFEEDSFETMTILTRIMHLQSDQVPATIAFKLLYQVAVLCDKYDLKRCLGPWTDIWTKPYLDCYARQGYEEWLFISIVFQYGGLFKDLTRHLVINSEISEQGTLVTSTGFDLSERISSIILDRITKSRAETMFVVLDLYWQELCRLRVPFNGHIGGSPDPVSNLGSQDKALKRTPAPAPEPVSFIQASALDQAMLTPKS